MIYRNYLYHSKDFYQKYQSEIKTTIWIEI